MPTPLEVWHGASPGLGRSRRPELPVAGQDARRPAAGSQRKLCVTAGSGSDHVDLGVAAEPGGAVTEATICNPISVAERAVMLNIAPVRNYIPSYQTFFDGGWSIADCVRRADDVGGMAIGTVASGCIGFAGLRLLYPFNVNLCYVDRRRLPESGEEVIDLTDYGDGVHASVKEMGQRCDVVPLNCRLHPGTAACTRPDVLRRRGARVQEGDGAALRRSVAQLPAAPGDGRLYPFNVDLCYVDRRRLPESGEEVLDLTYYGDGVHASVKEMGRHCDVKSFNCRLHPGTAACTRSTSTWATWTGAGCPSRARRSST